MKIYIHTSTLTYICVYIDIYTSGCWTDGNVDLCVVVLCCWCCGCCCRYSSVGGVVVIGVYFVLLCLVCCGVLH